MMAAETTLLFLYSSLFILLQCVANAKPNCTPSACGIISNISYPFRVKGDPDYCGDRRAELACENNVTFFYLKSHKYYVKAINGTTIRLVDTSINNQTCSFPTLSAYSHRWTNSFYSEDVHNSPINLMSCPHPLKNSSSFTNITHCQDSDSPNSRFSYIKIGRMMASDVTETCRVDVIGLTSWRFQDLSNSVSVEEIRRSLLYGFEIYFCRTCSIPMTAWEKFKFFLDEIKIPFIVLLAVAALTGALVNPIIGVTLSLGLLLCIGRDLHYAIKYKEPSTFLYKITGFMLSSRRLYLNNGELLIYVA